MNIPETYDLENRIIPALREQILDRYGSGFKVSGAEIDYAPGAETVTFYVKDLETGERDALIFNQEDLEEMDTDEIFAKELFAVEDATLPGQGRL